MLRNVAMATNFGTLFVITGFGVWWAITLVVWQLATRSLILGVGFRVQAIRWRHRGLADFEVLRDVAMATIFGFLYKGCTLAPPEEYDWTVDVRRRYGLMSNYFDHLFYYVNDDNAVNYCPWALSCNRPHHSSFLTQRIKLNQVFSNLCAADFMSVSFINNQKQHRTRLFWLYTESQKSLAP